MRPTDQLPSLARDPAARSAAERELALAGAALPAAQTQRWMAIQGRGDGFVLIARDAAGWPRRGAGVSIGGSRALPGHRLYRVERFGADTAGDDVALLGELATLARTDGRCLRCTVEIFERDPERRARLATTLRGLGFARVTAPRMYERTVALDFAGTEDDLFAAIDKTARRHVRAPAKRGLDLRPIMNVGYAPRIRTLLDATFRRTGGQLHHVPWDRIIEWSVSEPKISRVVGLFDPRTPGPDGLVSMAWGCVHGDYGTYEAGAGIRRADLGSTPLNYAPLWDLITWVRQREGARWFDLGGASSGDTEDPLAGNLDFKRYFSNQILDVAEEWELEPHAGRAALARAVGSAVRSAGRLRSMLRRGG